MILRFPLSVTEQLVSNFSQNRCQVAAFANPDSIDMFCFLGLSLILILFLALNVIFSIATTASIVVMEWTFSLCCLKNIEAQIQFYVMRTFYLDTSRQVFISPKVQTYLILMNKLNAGWLLRKESIRLEFRSPGYHAKFSWQWLWARKIMPDPTSW